MEKNSENKKNNEKHKNENLKDLDNKDSLDSPVNTTFKDNRGSMKSLTHDEDAATDPNKLKDKPGFKKSN